MSYAFSTGRELIALCEKENLTIAEVMIRREAETSEKTRFYQMLKRIRQEVQR